MEALLAAVRGQGGIMRSARLVAAGHRARVIETALARRALIRVRRVWVALPDADPDLVAAARAGVVLTCITEARRRGLWVMNDGIHVAAHPHAGRVAVAESVRVHRAVPLVPRHPDHLVDPIENVLVAVAMCQTPENAHATWESALNQGLVDRQELARLDLPARARAVLDEALPFADSGLESFVPRRLRWMRLRILPQAWIAGHRVDFLIGDRLVLQIDGGHHVGRQRESDIRHDAQLMLLGYHVIRVGYRQVVDDWPAVQHLIVRAVAQGLHLAR